MWECEGTLSVLCTVTLWHSSLLLWWPSPPSPAPWDLQCPAGEIPARIHSLYTPSEKLGFERGWVSGSIGSWVIIVLCALVGWCFLFVGFWATCQIMLFKCIYWHFKRSFSYFEQCASSLSLTHTHTSMGNVLAPGKIQTQIFECLPEKYLYSKMTEHLLIIYECNFIPVTILRKLSQAPPPVLTCD